MTTVVYKAPFMAADTGARYNGSAHPYARKIMRAEDGTLYGVTGNAAECQGFLDWVEDGRKGESPKPRSVEDGKCSSYNVLIAAPGRPLELLTAFGVERMYHAEYFAVGCGTECALGALYMGASAKEAVEAVRHHDAGAFGWVDVLAHDA